ncbi:T9SS sorting signal type C domain-containing protein [Flavobacterium lindanitolerans]|uniref:T9SS sorting signal type C domain-containing protein n=1 Tax=Flavobacterium lindanitolerans TaxID=428988 RepID=UPI0027BA5BDA|nr:T9SS sorting signal type C domain-containing protein [Flavobacterium lindanitolerans]MDQ7961564.1 T9SS sorting signal type C domain-containing protein [Flavobacterium lindanitolerans]
MKSLFLGVCMFMLTGMQAQITITLGSGTSSSTSSPVASWYNSSANESIYTGTEIGSTGTITKISYQKASGSSTIEPGIKVYMKLTETAVSGTTAYTIGSLNFNNYTLVYDGNLPNSSTTGTMEITLQTPFVFSNLSRNLSVLVIGSTCIESGRPQYRYTTTPSKMSAGFTDGSIGCGGTNSWTPDSSMSPVWERPNLILTLASSLAIGEKAIDKNDIQVIAKNGQLQAFSKKTPIQEITVFDLSGRKLAEMKHDSETVLLDLNLAKQILIVRVKTNDNTIVNKKIVF